MKVEIDGRSVEVEPGATILEAAERRAATSRRSASTTAWRRSAPAASAWSPPRARPARWPRARRPCREDMKVDTTDETSRRIAAATVELVLSELPEPPGEHTELADGRALLRHRRAALAGRAAPPRARPAPPLPGAPARAVHLVRALRARLRRDPGRVRADRHRARLPLRHHGRPGQRLRGLDLRFRAAPAPIPARPTRSPSTPCSTWLRRTLDKEVLRDFPLRRDHDHDLRLLRGRVQAGGAPLRRADRLDQPCDGRPRQQGPHLRQGPLRAPVRALARPPHRAARARERRLPARVLGRGDRPHRRRASAASRPSTGPTRSPGWRPRARPTRTAT